MRLLFQVFLCVSALLLAAALGSAHQGHESSQRDAAATGADLQERLGEYLPLDLEFFDEQGQTVRLAELIRVPTIIAPVFYGCTHVCYFLQDGLARALPEVRLTPGETFQVLSISFDELEGPDLARRARHTYLSAMQGRFPENGWRFLTGDENNIARFLAAIGFQVQRQDKDFLHPVAAVVVAADGKIVRYLHGTRFLPMHLNIALSEASRGEIGYTIKKMLEFCFSYDPVNKTYVFNLLRVAASVTLACAAAFLAFLLLTGRKKRPS